MFNKDTLGDLIAVLRANRQTGSTTALVRSCRLTKFFHSNNNPEHRVPIILTHSHSHADMLRRQYNVNACSVSNLYYLYGNSSPVLVEKEVLAMLANDYRNSLMDNEKTVEDLQARLIAKDSEIVSLKRIVKILQEDNK